MRTYGSQQVTTPQAEDSKGGGKISPAKHNHLQALCSAQLQITSAITSQQRLLNNMNIVHWPKQLPLVTRPAILLLFFFKALEWKNVQGCATANRMVAFYLENILFYTTKTKTSKKPLLNRAGRGRARERKISLSKQYESVVCSQSRKTTYIHINYIHI